MAETGIEFPLVQAAGPMRCFPQAGPITTLLQRPYFGLGGTVRKEGGPVEWQPTHGDWARQSPGEAWAARRLGARPAGVDLTPARLATARALRTRSLAEALRLLGAGARLTFLVERAADGDEVRRVEREERSVLVRAGREAWRRLLRESGFELERAVELAAGDVWAAKLA